MRKTISENKYLLLSLDECNEYLHREQYSENNTEMFLFDETRSTEPTLRTRSREILAQSRTLRAPGQMSIASLTVYF